MVARFQALALLAASLLALPIHPAQAQRPGNAKASIQRAMDDGWMQATEAAKKGDASALAALYTDDAMVIDPSMPTVIGKANIENAYKGILASMKLLTMTHEQTSFDMAGDLAVETGTFTQTWQAEGKSPQQVSGRYTIVWKNVAGRWLVLRDVGTPMPPEPAKN